jgi:hypothetical protein
VRGFAGGLIRFFMGVYAGVVDIEGQVSQLYSELLSLSSELSELELSDEDVSR